MTAIIEEPSPVVIQDSFTITNASCFGASDGMIELSSSGGSGTYEYSIDGATFSLSPLTGLTANTYTISARDGNGCLSNNTQTITVGQPTALEVSASFDGSQVNLAAAGGTTPYEYSLDRGTFQSEAIFTLGNGNYTFTVRDANGCEANTQEVTTVTSTDLNVELITNLYPNPVQNQLTIQHSSVIRQVRIADFNGKFISSYLGKENAASIDVSTLKKGVYLIEVKSTDGSVSYLRFVKE